MNRNHEILTQWGQSQSRPKFNEGGSVGYGRATEPALSTYRYRDHRSPLLNSLLKLAWDKTHSGTYSDTLGTIGNPDQIKDSYQPLVAGAGDITNPHNNENGSTQYADTLGTMGSLDNIKTNYLPLLEGAGDITNPHNTDNGSTNPNDSIGVTPDPVYDNDDDPQNSVIYNPDPIDFGSSVDEVNPQWLVDAQNAANPSFETLMANYPSGSANTLNQFDYQGKIYQYDEANGRFQDLYSGGDINKPDPSNRGIGSL